VFDLNDFDETLPGPFEYDLKRMAASFTIAARNNAFSKTDAIFTAGVFRTSLYLSVCPGVLVTPVLWLVWACHKGCNYKPDLVYRVDNSVRFVPGNLGRLLGLVNLLRIKYFRGCAFALVSNAAFAYNETSIAGRNRRFLQSIFR